MALSRPSIDVGQESLHAIREDMTTVTEKKESEIELEVTEESVMNRQNEHTNMILPGTVVS